MRTHATLLAIAALASGCGTFSGLDGSSTFACKAPDGVACTSVSGVYANPPVAEGAAQSKSGAIKPAEKPGEGKAMKPSEPVLPSYGATKFFHEIPANGTPILTPPRVLRVWVAPWKDQDGDLRDQSFLYVMWDRGEWNLQHTSDQILRQYAPVRMKSAATTGGGSQAGSDKTLAPDAEALPLDKPGSPEAVNAE